MLSKEKKVFRRLYFVSFLVYLSPLPFIVISAFFFFKAIFERLLYFYLLSFISFLPGYIYLHFQLKRLNSLAKKISSALDSVHKNKHLSQPIEVEEFRELKPFILSVNKLILELQEYRGFQINKIIDEANKAKSIVDIMPDAAMLIDENKKPIYLNEKARALLSINEDIPFPDCVGNNIFCEKIKNLFTFDGDSNVGEITVNLENKSVRNYLVVIKKFEIVSLKKKGLAIIIRDITKDKEFEAAKEDFFHMITHDMRSPVSTIEGYCEMIRRKVPYNEELEKYFQNIFYSSKKLKGMLEDILNYKRLKEKKAVLSIDYVSPQEILNNIAVEHDPMAQAKNIKLFVSSQIDKGKIMADKVLLERAVSNLVGNAIKFSPSDANVEMKFFIKDGFAIFSVKDEGPGIPEEKKSIIFEKYISYDDDKNRGFGLGLALCRLVADIHGGKIDLLSQPGKGSEFFIYLPMRKKETS